MAPTEDVFGIDAVQALHVAMKCAAAVLEWTKICHPISRAVREFGSGR